MEEHRLKTQQMTDALNALPGGPGAIAHMAYHLAELQASHLAVRTTALNAAATLTAGMSELEVQTDHESREHDPLAPVSDVIALAGEFEEWLSRPQGSEKTLFDLRVAAENDEKTSREDE